MILLPRPVLLPSPTEADGEREEEAICRLTLPAERAYARQLIDWWEQAPEAQGLTVDQAARAFNRVRRAVKDRCQRAEARAKLASIV